MDEYNIDDLISRYTNMDYLSIHDDLSREVESLDRQVLTIHRRKDVSEYRFRDYRQHAGDFLFFLNTGIPPSGIGIQGLKRFLPVIKNLVEKGQLKPEALDLFKSKN